MEPPVVPLSPRNHRHRPVTDYSSEEDQANGSWFVTAPHSSYPISPASYQSAVAYPTSPTSYHAPNPTRSEERGVPPRSDSSERPQYHRQVSAWSSSVRSTEERLGLVPSPGLEGPDHAPPDARRLDAQKDDFRNGDFNSDLEAIEEADSYAPSIMSGSRHSSHTNNTRLTSSSSRLPDFLGSEIFQMVLHNPATAHQLLLFSQSRLCGENMEFLEKVDRYHSLINEVTKVMFEIHRDYVSVNAASQINIASNLLTNVNKSLKHTLTSMLPKMESVFVDAQNDIERLVASDVYPRFVRHQMSMSAAKALASDRNRYAGLGDCFVLTSPSKADNPIVFASDGFVKVTGYARNEIIPRNCRFLQGRHTERSAVKRIKRSVDDRKESVELLLNYKKNGEPFWNLLYTAPLYDTNGKVVFFIGGQINCSTTIHNASDIIRILSISEDVDNPQESEVVAPAAAKESKTSSFFKAFRPAPKEPPMLRQAGMEHGLLTQMEKFDLGKQMDAFYSAYSTYLVINYSTFFIAFHSAGIADLLYPYRPQGSSQLLGADIFRFLKFHAFNDSSKGFKDRVKAALRMGQPISLDLTLCTRRYMGFEKFVTHWTPLKDGQGDVEFVILTLGSQKS